ncbi:iron complex outermembrane recepter protein [Halopseudomonas sabulinigri]|uniref:Iron complex outermembrane recepter protein n=1 Tax=Halopseudomonas sabulinigri TaxID=472181 RepID=A0A1H1N303_9GAMM|nr:TonB-dependent receptor [Halopseudomonas sabulinigri]SDR92559.1 iron complex outermembrane recepter protein [Halopseudomonas sabulinigri]
MPYPLKIALTLLLLAPLSSPAANEPGDGSEMEDLLALLDQETALATQSKMNTDYVPGMVTVLHGEELRSYGAGTVADALDQVAGFYMSLNNVGDPVAIVRGVGANVNGSNLKVLVDGVAVNRATDASADWVFRIPMTQVDRVEVIRGPGSALHGEFAFSGVINIITRRDNLVSVRGGSHNLKQGDILATHSFESGAQIAINASLWGRDDSDRMTNPDNFQRPGVGYSPGNIYDDERGGVLFLDGSHQGYRLQVTYSDVERGAWYGRNGALPYELEPREETTTSLNLSKTWSINDDLTMDASLGYLKTDLEFATYLPIPKGEDPPGPRPPIANNVFRRDANKDEAQRAKVVLHWDGLAQHQLLLGLDYAHSKVTGSSIKTTREGFAPVYGTPDEELVLDGAERGITSLTLQDQWTPVDNLELTLGARYDDYDDWGSSVSPRVAAVWRASDRHIFKAQYAEAFRPPTLANQNPGPNTYPRFEYDSLQEERLKSTELAYIFNGSGYKLRSTVFHTEVRDLIEFYIPPGRPPVLRNRGDVTTQGVELEWEQQIGRDWEWHANLSYIDAEDKRDADSRLIGAVDWLANLGASWRATPHTRHALSVRYVGDQEGYDPPSGGGRYPETYDSYTLVDYALTVNHLLGAPNLTLQASINNIFDRQYDVVSNPQFFPGGLPRGERTGWATLEYQF